MAGNFEDEDEKNLENQMEKIRLAVSGYDIDQFSNKLQRNMMERRQHFDVKDRISIKNTIDFMKKNIPIDGTIPLGRRLHVFATANDYEIKYCENEVYLSSPDFVMSITCTNDTVERVTISWFRCQGNGVMEGTTIKNLINENKFRLLSQKIKLYLRTIDSTFTSDQKGKIFDILIQDDDEYLKISSDDFNSGPIGKFFKRTDLEPSYLCIFCDRLLLSQQEAIFDQSFKCYIDVAFDEENPVKIESTDITYTYILRFSKPLLMFSGYAKDFIFYSCQDVSDSMKGDIYTQLLGITKRKKGLVTNEKFHPTVRYIIGDELIYRNEDLIVNSLSFTARENLSYIIEKIRIQLLVNHLIESIKKDTILEHFILSKNIYDINVGQPNKNVFEFTLPTPNNMKLIIQVTIFSIDNIRANGIFSNGESLGQDIASIFVTTLLRSWSIPLSILALMKKLGFDTKYNLNVNCLKKQSSSELSKVGNAWHYFLKFTKKWQKKQLKKMKNNISNLFIDNPVLLNGKAVDILGTLVPPIQSDIDMTYLKPKQTFYSPYPPNVNNGQRILLNKNIQKQNVVVDILPTKPKSDLEAMAEIGQNLSKDSINSSQRGVLTKYSDNVIKTPTVIGKYPVQNDNSQFVSPLNGGDVQNYQQNLSLKNLVSSSSINSSDQNVTHTKHKKSKSKKPDFAEGVFKVPNINILPVSSNSQQSFSDDVEIKKNKKDSTNKKSKKIKKSTLPESLASVTHQQDSLKVTFSRFPLENHSNKTTDESALNNGTKSFSNVSKIDFKIKHENVSEEKIVTVEKNKDVLESGKAKSKLKKILENSNQSIKGKSNKNSNDVVCEVEIDKIIKQEAVISPPNLNVPISGNIEAPANPELKIKIKRPKITIKNLEPPKIRELQEVKEIKEEANTKIVDLSSSSPKIKEPIIKKSGIILSKSKSANDAKEKKSNKRKATDHTPSPRSKSSKKEKLDLNLPPLPEQTPADTFNAIGKKNAFDLLKNFRIPKLEGKEEKVVEKVVDKPIEKTEKIEKIKEKLEKNKDSKFKERHKERDREREREKDRDRCRDKYNKERDSSKRRSLSPINRGNLVSPSKIPKLECYTSSVKSSNDKTTTSTTDITKLVGFIPLAAIKPSIHASLSQNRHSSRSHSNSSDHYRSGSYSSHSRKSSVNDTHHSSSRSHHTSSSHNHRSSSKLSVLPKSPLTSPTSTSSGSKWVKMSQPVQQPIQIQTKVIDPRIRIDQQGKQTMITREPSPCDLTIDESDN